MSWFVGWAVGTAAGAGFNHVRDQAKIKEALDPRWYQPVTAPLPVERWSVAEGLCMVGMPSGWRDLTTEESLRMSTETRARVALAACVTTPDPRLGCSATSFAILDRGPQSAGADSHLMFVALDEMVQARIDAVPDFSSYGAPWRIGLDGERAFVHHLIGSVPGDGFGVDHRVAMMSAEAYTIHRTSVYVAMFNSPTETYQSYLPALWTMLGNWRWLPNPG